MPVYIVTAPTEPKTERLVEAPNAASARNHVARQLLAVNVARGPDLFRIAKEGGDLEQVGASAVIDGEDSQNVEVGGTTPLTDVVEDQIEAEATGGKGGKGK